MPFGMLSLVDPRKHVLDGSTDAQTGRGTFRRVSQSIGFWGLGKRVSRAKAGGPIVTSYTSYDVLLHGGAFWGEGS